MTTPGVRTLYRNVEQGWIGGVCAGLAEYMRADVTLVRIIAILATIFTAVAPGLIAYLVCWVLIPPRPMGHAAPPRAPPTYPPPPAPPEPPRP